ncbi:hypothetical protein [[Limnothrix rosea] IAM M-220]|uniref:hypothetical protein n=1 Tax=[Limnothrix rosea] IAM M-220 TaxID=454133 RepID=UPI00095FD8B8|nr:hypothetical protein [[Limnothrix rosea] IAM M-220]OKH17347.1 hypothetical protein NIES208_09660 [[Limnothrix rosea] IAM M-220]
MDKLNNYRPVIKKILTEYDQKSLITVAQIEDSSEANVVELFSEVKIHKVTSDGQRMAEALNQIAGTSSLSDLEPIAWQKEIRGDRLTIFPK